MSASVNVHHSSNVYHHVISSTSSIHSYEWEEKTLTPFNELILTWNAFRPAKGYYTFLVSFRNKEWTSWIPYANWGSLEQTSFSVCDAGSSIQTCQDIINCLDGTQATGFRIRVEAHEGASLETLCALHACATQTSDFYFDGRITPESSINLKVPNISQLALDHPRRMSICSPTSTTAVLRYLTGNHSLDPLSLASQVYDRGFDSYGNWSFNAAQAFAQLGKGWQCWVARLVSFDQVLRQLKDGFPVVASVRGPLPGSAQPYASGHLIAIKGYDAVRKKVICMDPAFPQDRDTTVHYELDHFIQAWKRRLFAAYFFRPVSSSFSTIK